jgi:hypothetical protein
LGVKEAGQRFRIAGIDNDKDLANKFGKKINALPTNPNFELAPFVDIPQSNKVLAVIHIASRRCFHCLLTIFSSNIHVPLLSIVASVLALISCE